MKNVIGLWIVAIGLTSSIAGQDYSKNKMTLTQQTELAVKKMTLNLDLSDAQQEKIKPLLSQRMAARNKMIARRKELKANKKRLNSEERYLAMNAKLDQQIAFKREMKRILKDEQYAKFERTAAKKMHQLRKKGKMKRRKKLQNKDK